MAVKFANNAKSTLNGAHNDSTTTITVTDGSVFPSLSGAEYFYMTLEDVSLNREIVKVTARSGNTLTVVRAQDGTTARSFSTADKAELRITVAGLTDIMALASDAIAALSSVYQPLDSDLTSWASVTRASGFDTFAATPSSANLRSLLTDETGTGLAVFATSPTLTTPVFSSIVNTGTLTLPTSTDTLVGRATTDTLTNKTLTSPTLSGTVAGSPTFSGAVYFSGGAYFTASPSVGAMANPRFSLYNNSGTASTLTLGADSGATWIGSFTSARLDIYTNSAVVASFSAAGAFTVGGVAVPTISSTSTLTNKTLSSPTLSGTVAGSPTADGSWSFSGAAYFASGSSGPKFANPYLNWYAADGSRNGYIQFMDSGAVSIVNEETNGNVNLAPNGTGVAQVNSVTIATASNTLTLTNKTLSSPTVSGTIAGAASWSGTQTFLSTTNYFGATGDSATHVTYFRADAGYIADIAFQSGSSSRWTIRKDGSAESGSNAGSGLAIIARDDAGASLGNAVYITRATMAVALGGTSLTLGGVAVPTISSTSTFTNKTLSSPTLSGTIAGTPTIASAWAWSTAQNFPTGSQVNSSNILTAATGAALAGAVFTGAIQTTTVEMGHATDTTISRLAAGQIGVEGKAALQHDGSYTSGKVTFSTSDPSGGSDGDVWYKHAA